MKKKPKIAENETEYGRMRKRLDIALLTDSYLKDNIARRLKIDFKEVPPELVEACRPLLQLKRKIKEINKDKVFKKLSVYIVAQDLGGIVYTSAFTTLDEARKCRDAWWVKWGRRSSKPTLHEQIVEDRFNE